MHNDVSSHIHQTASPTLLSLLYLLLSWAFFRPDDSCFYGGLHNPCWHPLNNNRYYFLTWCVRTVPASCHRCATVTTLGCTLNRFQETSQSCQGGSEHFTAVAKLLSYRTIKIYDFEHYQLSIFQPADVWFGFATGNAGHSVFTAEVFLCAADVLHPLRKSCKWAKSELVLEENGRELQSCWIIYDTGWYFRHYSRC